MEVDFDIKNTGQTKAINGFDTRQVVATITVREKGKTIEQSGGIIMTVDTWLTKQASLKEIADFERRYYEKLAGPITAVDAQQMATAMAMFPGLKEAFARLSREDLGGTAIQSTTTIDAVKSAEQMQQQAAGGPASSGDTEPAVGWRRDRRLHAAASAAAGRKRRQSRRQPRALDLHDDEQRSVEDRPERDGGRSGDAGGVQAAKLRQASRGLGKETVRERDYPSAYDHL